jgi:hypothetical protein
MHELKNVEIFKVGEVTDSLGYTDKYTIEDLQEIADSYNKETHEAPIVIGHDNDKNWAKLLTSKTQLANGWVSKLNVENSTLLADIKVDDFTFEAIESGGLKKRSIGLYPRNSKNNPNPNKFSLRHLALLGVEPPAVKGLQDIKIYTEKNSMDESTQLLNEKAAEWLAFALIDEGNGFNGEIVEFIPVPSEDNNWLYDENKETYSGQFVDEKEQLFNFSITKEGEDWVTSMKMSLTEEEEQEEVELTEETEEVTKETEEVELVEETEEVELVEETEVAGDNMAQMANQIAGLQAKLKEYEAKEKENIAEETLAYCDEMYNSGYLTEAQIKRDALYKIISALTEIAGSVTYSENNKEINVVKSIKSLLKTFPKQLAFSEAVVARAGEISQSYASPHKNGTEESNKEYAQIRQYMEKHSITNFGIGYREYRLNK